MVVSNPILQHEEFHSTDSLGIKNTLSREELNDDSVQLNIDQNLMILDRSGRGWRELPHSVEAQFILNNYSEKTFERFSRCGNSFMNFISTDFKNHPIPNSCGLRFCPKCRSGYQAKVLNKAYRYLLHNNRLGEIEYTTLLTLTLRKTNIKDDLFRIRKAWHHFKILLKKQFPKLKSQGVRGIYAIETGGKSFDNVHLHAYFINAPYMKQKIISELWKKCTKDSYIVDVRGKKLTKIRPHKRAAFLKGGIRYVVKYIMKSINLETNGEFQKEIVGRNQYNWFKTKGDHLGERPPSKCGTCLQFYNSMVRTRYLDKITDDLNVCTSLEFMLKIYK